MKIERSYKAPGEYSGKPVTISAEQFTSDIANAHATGERVYWFHDEDEESIFYTVVIVHDEGQTSFNWEEKL